MDWLLDCEPRLVQLEALSRSYTGVALRNHKEDPPIETPLSHAGKPTAGWGHLLEMRLGKTPLLLNEFLLFRRDYGVKKAFVLSPNKYKGTWALEAEKFGVDVPLHVFDSNRRKEFIEFMRATSEGMVFVHYEALNSDANMALFESFVNGRTYLGADESVLLKNRQASMTKRAMVLSKKAAVVRPMTGKPSPQGVQDLFSQLRFARRLDGWNFFQFRNKFAIMGGYMGKKVVGVKNEGLLQDIMRQCCFFARRADWGTDIECDYETIKIKMSKAQKKAYKDMEDDFITWLESGEAVSVDQVITKHLKQQQISSGFILDDNRTVHEIMPFEKTPKFQDLKDRLENYINCKVIIIAHFNETLNRLEEALNEYNPAVIRGNDYMRRFGKNVDEEKLRFNTDKKCRVILGQSKAVKYGHTLMGTHSDPCLATVYYENSYSLDDRAQTEERNQGEGQLGAIHVMDYVSSPVEGRIVKALQRKEQIAAVIMGYYKEIEND